MKKRDELIKIFSMNIRVPLSKLHLDFEKMQEIRLRINKPIFILWNGKEFFLTKEGEITNNSLEALIVTKNDLKETMEYIANYSLYAFEDELKQGFITIQGGHRVGMTGKTVLENNQVKSIKYISCINIRISHEIKGCASKVIPFLTEGDSICHTLIISPPRCGKTTLLRDLIRQISNGTSNLSGKTVGVVDERSEIGGSYLGIPQNDIGIRTDILDCCPKAVGMMMLIRSMSPEVIAIDEIGSNDDVHAMESAIYCGCKIIATIHGNSMEDMKMKPLFKELVSKKIFDKYIILSNENQIGEVKGIYSKEGEQIC